MARSGCVGDSDVLTNYAEKDGERSSPLRDGGESQERASRVRFWTDHQPEGSIDATKDASHDSKVVTRVLPPTNSIPCQASSLFPAATFRYVVCDGKQPTHRTPQDRTARAVAPEEARYDASRASSGATVDSPLSSDAFPSESLFTIRCLGTNPLPSLVKNLARNLQLSPEQSMAPLPPSLFLPFVRKHRQPFHSRPRRLPATLGLRLKCNVRVSIAELDRWSSGTRGQASRFQDDATFPWTNRTLLTSAMLTSE